MSFLANVIQHSYDITDEDSVMLEIIKRNKNENIYTSQEAFDEANKSYTDLMGYSPIMSSRKNFIESIFKNVALDKEIEDKIIETANSFAGHKASIISILKTVITDLEFDGAIDKSVRKELLTEISAFEDISEDFEDEDFDIDDDPYDDEESDDD